MGEHGLLFEVMVYLAAAVVVVPLAIKLRLGSVLGYLAAGCLVGPWVLGLVSDVENIMHFSEFGVVLMLFVIGLELEWERLVAMRRAVFGGGAAQMAICAVPLFAAAMAAGLPWRGALVAGLALALSSTAIAMQSMTERNLVSTPMGRSAFGILLFQDIAAIPLIALVPLLAGKGGGDWWGALEVLGAIVGVVVLGITVLPRLLRIVATSNLREVFTACALLVVVGIAQVMNMVGLSMGLGAFLGGVLLASSEYRHALETDIEPFKGLLLGLFFLSVGMSIDFGLLADRPITLALLVVGFVAIKLAAMRLLATRMAIAQRQRLLFAALLAQGGEFAFVVFGVAREAQLLPGQWDGLLTLAVALSMAVTPIILLAHDLNAARVAGNTAREYDEIHDEHAPVIIAGFGRYGQVVSRLLLASGIRATVLDHDPETIDAVRRFGFRVFYGDATRTDLLHAAGAHHARLLVNAIDDIDDNLALVDKVRHEFPKLKIIARARNVTHWFALRQRGIEVVERESFESALVTGRHALEALGVAPYEARERADRFRRHNLRNLEQLLDAVGDDDRRISMVRAAREELEEMFRRDTAELDRVGQAGWRHQLEQLEQEDAGRREDGGESGELGG